MLLEIQPLLRVLDLIEGVAARDFHQLFLLFALDGLLLLVGERDPPGIRRIEQFVEAESEDVPFDAMLQRKYRTIDQQVFTISKKPDPIVYIDDMAAYNRQEGLALSDEEIA